MYVIQKCAQCQKHIVEHLEAYTIFACGQWGHKPALASQVDVQQDRVGKSWDPWPMAKAHCKDLSTEIWLFVPTTYDRVPFVTCYCSLQHEEWRSDWHSWHSNSSSEIMWTYKNRMAHEIDKSYSKAWPNASSLGSMNKSISLIKLDVWSTLTRFISLTLKIVERIANQQMRDFVGKNPNQCGFLRNLWTTAFTAKHMEKHKNAFSQPWRIFRQCYRLSTHIMTEPHFIWG